MRPDRPTLWPDAGPDDVAGMEMLRPAGARPPVCPPPELVQAAASGTLPPVLQARVEAHVAQCGFCRTLSSALEEISAGDLTEEERARVHQRVLDGIASARRAKIRTRLWRWSAAAALVIVATAASLFIWQSGRTSPTPRLSVFTLDKPALPAAVDAPVPEGRVSPLVAERRELADALAPFRVNNFQEGAQRLSAFIARYPRSSSAHFYLGVSELFLDRDGSALVALETAERLARDSDPTLAREASWHLALAYRRTGQIDSARNRLQALCAGRDVLALRACDGLRELTVISRLSGVVTSVTGEALAGVKVGEHVFGASGGDYMATHPTPFAGTTDVSGTYSVAGVPLAVGPETIVRGSKPGYFTATIRVPVSSNMRADFRLTPWTHIVLGAVVKDIVRAGNGTCRVSLEPCVQFALTIPSNGTLEVSVAATTREGTDLWVETPRGEIYAPWTRAPLRLAIPVVGGETLQIYVVSFPGDPRSFELTTRLR